MKIEIISCLNDNYSYLIFEKETNIISIVDPSDFNACDEVIRKYKKLDYILNTHHHLDHVGGNLELKDKYNSKILASEKDKRRIPGIDILLKDKQIFKIGNLEFKIIFIPGHTSGHIAFYFKKEKILFSGDTLFSLGCGRVFEGTHAEMLNSLNKLKSLPSDTKVYCGHEYTKRNLDFCLKYDNKNQFLKDKIKEVNLRLKDNLPTIPTSIGDEIKTNIFLRCEDKAIKQALSLKDSSDQEIFAKLRDLKDAF
ncbi:MAG: hydroxyacylglutathione hydrolase [Candidatus Pelagibacter sp. TMED128]|nr:MAG: hydroxyacylglutathione hydrolase [Candidatus Pelagibacter sp. TMED128]